MNRHPCQTRYVVQQTVFGVLGDGVGLEQTQGSVRREIGFRY